MKLMKRRAAEKPAEKEQAAAPLQQADRIEAAAHADLASAKELRASLLKEIVGGQDKRAELASINAEIATHEATLKAIAEAKEALAAANSNDARKARWDATLAELKEAVEDARAIGKEAGNLLQLVSELGSRLQSIAAKKATISARMASAVQRAGGTERAVDERHKKLTRALAALSLPDHVLRALWDAGLGRVGVELDPEHFDLRPFGRLNEEAGMEPVETAVQRAVDQLRGIANAALTDLQQEAA